MKNYKWTMTLLTIAFVNAFLSGQAKSEDLADLPSLENSILKEQFPVYVESADEENIERGLRRYRAQLETFRQDILEGYNRAIRDYRHKIVEADAKLEVAHARGRIMTAEYDLRHEYLKQELKKSDGDGEYMKPYFNFVKKYKAEAKWVEAEIKVEEKKKFTF